ncbi:MAG: HAD family phosphatase, partial [Anaerolineae bacterium]|nr:HAD family phosphatase [Anaerolineae bacterium]
MIDPKAIIFDMDGLLVDSEVIWAEAETRLLGARGKGYDGNVPRDEFIGLRVDEFMEKLCAAFNMDENPENLYDELIEDMLQLIPDKVVQKPGAREILDYVRLHNIPCAIAYSSPQSINEAVVETQG